MRAELLAGYWFYRKGKLNNGLSDSVDTYHYGPRVAPNANGAPELKSPGAPD